MPRRFLRRLLRIFNPQPIAVKLALFICLLVTLLFLILGIALTQTVQDVLKRNIKDNHEKIALQAARQISLTLNRPAELLRTTGRIVGRIHADPWMIETVLVEMSLDFPMFEEISAVNRAGREIASSNPGHPKRKRQEEPAFKQARTGRAYYSPIQVKEDYLPHMTVAQPFRRLGSVQGVLIADVNLRGIWEIVDSVKIGHTGRALLISKDGLLIAHPDKKRVLKNEDWFAHLAAGSSYFERVGSRDYTNGEGTTILGSYVPIQSPVPLILGVEMESGEAYGLVARMRRLIWFVLLLSLFVSITGSFAISGWLVRPVQSLEEWSKRIALGDFDFRLAPRTSDELGRLFIRFKRMSGRLKSARERERLAALGVAATTISHKLRNSIVSLKTFAQLLPERKRDPYFMQRFEKDFAVTIEHLEKIFNNLSQITSTRKLNLEMIHLPDIFQNIEHAFQETWTRQKVDFRLQVPTDLPAVQGDKEQLQEVIVNLLQNAVQSMPKGGLLVLRAVYDSVDSTVKISVMDSGCGISKQNLDQIFKPFFTTKHGGMGLGLSISKKIIEDHHGDLTVSSVEGRGSVFTLALPALIKKKISIHEPAELIKVQ